tara:strand:+ start:1892 stop:2128 length:237 start_codon:yes stop_codon:yes gene_type:complete
MTFIVYSKKGCPYCTKVQKVLELSEQKHIVYKLGTDYTLLDFYEMFGKDSTFPKVKLGEELIGGCTETVSYLKENNII